MRISIITLFPEVFEPILNSSILKRAQKKDKIDFELINLREFGEGKHQVVDGRPYGGGAGMILKPDVLTRALKSIPKLEIENCKLKIILMSASGATYKQSKAQELSQLNHLIIVCGHYEGVDQRFIDNYIDEEISIGDYVLTGGEIPAMVITDSITRLIPDVLKKPEAVQEESFSNFTLNAKRYTLIEYPHYTRPDVFEDKLVPDILKSGDHKAVENWRKEEGLKKTKKVRPDLLVTT